MCRRVSDSASVPTGDRTEPSSRTCIRSTVLGLSTSSWSQDVSLLWFVLLGSDALDDGRDTVAVSLLADTSCRDGAGVAALPGLSMSSPPVQAANIAPRSHRRTRGRRMGEGASGTRALVRGRPAGPDWGATKPSSPPSHRRPGTPGAIGIDMSKTSGIACCPAAADIDAAVVLFDRVRLVLCCFVG